MTVNRITRRVLACLLLGLFSVAALSGQQAKQRYEPNWASIDKRPMPEWFNEAKFGIFVVWGPYSVPAYAPTDGYAGEAYAEWYGKRVELGQTARDFHYKNYGKDFPYEQFADQFKAELWDPDFWADIFVRSGAKYVVTTANYHDGFALWPTKYAKTRNTDQWNSMVRGPKRDLLGELNEAGRKRGLQMGIYYSLYEWWHPLWLTDKVRFVEEHLHPKFKEVVTKHKPPVIFLDGEWEGDDKLFRSEELAAWLYNESPVADTVAVNDRWGASRSLHGDYYSSEYGGGEYPPWHPWQEDRGIGKSYGYNREENIDDYNTGEELIQLLSKVAGNGGNLLLDIGPTADGRIPVIMQDRLLQIGRWLKVNGEAIYGSRANPFWPRQFPWGTATTKNGKIYLHLHDRGKQEINLRGLKTLVRSAQLLSNRSQRIALTEIGDGVRLTLPRYLPDEPVTVIELELAGKMETDTTPYQYDDGRVLLHAYGMKIHGEKARIHYNGYQREVHIADWTDASEYVSADFTLLEPGDYEVQATYSCKDEAAGSEFAVEVQGQRVTGKAASTGGTDKYTTVKLGMVQLSQTGRATATIRAAATAGWRGLGLKSVMLAPVR